MKISIAICTWNRSHLLRQTLDSLANLAIPNGIELQLLVVDNNSTDDTKAVVDSFKDSSWGKTKSARTIDYLFESRQGHAISRNTAVANATGKYIVWTDNDVRVDPAWLSSYFDAFDRHPQSAFFGGPIQPVFPNGKPDWIDATWEKCKAVYAARDLGDQELQIGDGIFPYGANFAIRTDVQKQFLYDTAVGRSGSGMLGDDEIAVLRQVCQAGHHGFWVPAATLEHIIPADRATPDYIGRYFVGQGRTNIRQGKVNKSAGQAWRESMFNQIKWRIKRRMSPPDEWVSHLIRASLSRGEYLELRQQEGGL